MDIKIAFVSHKKVKVPQDPIYVPIEAGAALREEHFFETRDDTKNNISLKNPYYCELTALYWAYKNLKCDILGLVHYRRLFMKSSFCFRKTYDNLIDQKRIERLLNKNTIILPKKRHYLIETNYSHYIHAHKKEPLDKMIEIIKTYYPEYTESLEKHLKKRTGHYFNMFIAKKRVITPLLDWMFDILHRVEKEIDISSYKNGEERVFGYLSELLFDVYCEKNDFEIREQKYLFFERQNWFKKIFNFLKRKVSHR